MNLPQIVQQISSSIQDQDKSEFSSIIKDVNIKENEEGYVVELVFDLSSKITYFRFAQHRFDSAKTPEIYHYFGTNSGAGLQFYIVRTPDALRYLLSSTWNDLLLALQKYDMENSELAGWLHELAAAGLIKLGAKKGEGCINPDLLPSPLNRIQVKDKEIFSIDEGGEKNKENPEKLMKRYLDEDNNKNRIVLVAPVIISKESEEVPLYSHPDYLELVKKANKLEETTAGSKNKETRHCHVCRTEKEEVDSDYTANLSRKGPNKVFITTYSNYAPYMNKNIYHKVYGMCGECYRKLKDGENEIINRFRSWIANENVFILPEALTGAFNYEHFIKLKSDVDLAFSTNNALQWLKNIESEAFAQGLPYTVNFMFYRADGKSFNVLESIEDVPVLRFRKVMKAINIGEDKLGEHLRYFSLGSVYRMVPVRLNNKGVQLDIHRVLSLYRVILAGEKVSRHVLYSYAVEALEKGMNQLAKSELDNYYNLNLTRYRGNKEDFFIRDLMMRYLALLQTCSELELLYEDNRYHYNRKGGDRVSQIETASEKVNEGVSRMESFLDEQEFSSEARALFFLGAITNRVAIAQMQKEHKSKPILKKIQFQGMTLREVQQLYNDVVEKLRQYDKMTLFAEAMMNRFHYYFGTVEKKWPLSEQANVFYIMSGYAYLVGASPPDISKEEEEATREELEDEEVNS